MTIWKKGFLIAALLIVGIVSRTLYFAGAFKSLHPVAAGEERLIKGIIGAEDITIDTKTGFALVSSDNRRKTRDGKPVKGAIFLVDYAEQPAKIRDLTDGFNEVDFHPHGISLYTDPSDSTQWLFVVNHKSTGHTVERFQFVDSTLIHSETVTSPLLIKPNDLVAVGKRTFYFTNDHDEDSAFSSWKDFLVIGTGQVGYFDGRNASILDRGIRYANGITVSPDGARLYVAACTDGSILVYNRAPFKQIGKIDCGTGVDNLEWDAAGHLWAGAHPKMLAFLGHAKDSSKRSPSQVLRITPEPLEAPQVETVYLNKGNPLSGSSVAAFYAGTVLVGGVFDEGILVSRVR